MISIFSTFLFLLLFSGNSNLSNLQDKKCQYVLDSDCKSRMDVVFVVDSGSFYYHPQTVKDYLFKLVCDLYIDFSYVRVGIIQRFYNVFSDKRMGPFVTHRRELNLSGSPEEVFNVIDNLSIERIVVPYTEDDDDEELQLTTLRPSLVDSRLMIREFVRDEKIEELKRLVVLISDINQHTIDQLEADDEGEFDGNETTTLEVELIVNEAGDYISEIACVDMYAMNPNHVCLLSDEKFINFTIKGVGFPKYNEHQLERNLKERNLEQQQQQEISHCVVEGKRAGVLSSSQAWIRDSHTMICPFPMGSVRAFWKKERNYEEDDGVMDDEIVVFSFDVNIGTTSWIRKVLFIHSPKCNDDGNYNIIISPDDNNDDNDDDADAGGVVVLPYPPEKDIMELFHLVGFPYFRFSLLLILLTLFSSFLCFSCLIFTLLILYLIRRVRKSKLRNGRTITLNDDIEDLSRNSGDLDYIERYFVQEEEEKMSMESEENYFSKTSKKRERSKKSCTFMVAGKHIKVDYGNKGINWRSPFGCGSDMGVGSSRN